MRTLSVPRNQLRTTALMTALNLRKPLYRGLGRQALHEILATDTQAPHWGSLSTGEGVCFTNDIDYALSFNSGGVLVTEQELLGPATDTRVPGYGITAEQRIRGNYDGYTLWLEILKDNTIITEPGWTWQYIYVARQTITKNQLRYAVRVGETP